MGNPVHPVNDNSCLGLLKQVRVPGEREPQPRDRYRGWACRTSAPWHHICVLCLQGKGRGGRPATTISIPSHILLIFSSEPPLNPRPSNIIFLKVSSPPR